MSPALEKGEILSGISSLIDKGEMTIVETHIFLLKQVIIKLTEERKSNSSEEVDFFTWKQQGIKLLEKIAPIERKASMFRATKEMLDTANQDVELLRSELEILIEKRKITKWAKRLDKNQTAEDFIKTNWSKYITAGLVDRGVIRNYDIGFLKQLEKYEPYLLESIPTAGIKTEREVQCLTTLGYTTQELSKLYAKSNRMGK